MSGSFQGDSLQNCSIGQTTADDRVKQTEIQDSRKPLSQIQGTFDFLVLMVILDPLVTHVSKLTRKFKTGQSKSELEWHLGFGGTSTSSTNSTFDLLMGTTQFWSFAAFISKSAHLSETLHYKAKRTGILDLRIVVQNIRGTFSFYMLNISLAYTFPLALPYLHLFKYNETFCGKQYLHMYEITGIVAELLST